VLSLKKKKNKETREMIKKRLRMRTGSWPRAAKIRILQLLLLLLKRSSLSRFPNRTVTTNKTPSAEDVSSPEIYNNDRTTLS
jgi:hypothetical protein